MEKIERINSIDTLRGLSVIFYLMFHFASWWTPSGITWILGFFDNSNLLFYIPYFGLVAAPIFIMVSGISIKLSIENNRKRNVSEVKIRNHILKRGFILIIFNMFLNFIYFKSGQYIWLWDMISTIGASSIIIFYLSKSSVKKRLIIVFLMIFSYPVLREILNIEASYTLAIYNAPWSLERFFTDLLTNGPGPIIPQSGLAILGSIIAEYLTPKTKMKEMTPKLLFSCFLLIIISTFLGYMPILTLWKDGLTWLQIFGIWSVVFIFLFWLQDIKKSLILIFKSLYVFYSLSLTLFFIHVIFGYLVIFLSGGPQKLGPYSFYLVFIFFCIFILILGTFWSKVKFKLSLEWFIIKLSN